MVGDVSLVVTDVWVVSVIGVISDIGMVLVVGWSCGGVIGVIELGWWLGWFIGSLEEVLQT